MGLQINCNRPVVIDTAAVAITTDASKLYGEKSMGKELEWKNMAYVTKVDAFGKNKKSEDRIYLKLEDGALIGRSSSYTEFCI